MTFRARAHNRIAVFVLVSVVYSVLPVVLPAISATQVTPQQADRHVCFKSVDGGATWFAADQGLVGKKVTGLAIDTSDRFKLYAATMSGLFKTTDAGTTWTATNSRLSGSMSPLAIAVVPGTPPTFFLGTNQGLFKSTNEGADWSPITLGEGVDSIRALVVDSRNPSLVYAGSDEAVFASGDGGNTWAERESGTIGGTGSIRLFPDLNRPLTTYAQSRRDVSRTTDGGATWETVIRGMPSGEVTAFVMDPVDTSTLYLSIQPQAVGNAELEVSVEVNPRPVAAGSFATYAITVENHGPDAASNVTVINNLPPSVTFNFCSPGEDGECGGSGNNRFITFETLDSGETVVMTIVARVNCGLTLDTDILNTVIVGSETTDPDTLNNSASATVSVVGSPITVRCPLDIVLPAASDDAGAVVNYNTPTVTHNCPGSVVACSPPSGSTFPIGTTTVNCTATSVQQDVASCSFTVTLTEPPLPFGPRIAAVFQTGKNLVVDGANFSLDSVILVNGVAQRTRNDDLSPTTRLIGKKVAKKITPGDTVTVEVLGPTGARSNQVEFTRPSQ